MLKHHKPPSKLSSSCSILMVEDNNDHAELIKRHISKVGEKEMTLERVISLNEAIELLDEKNFNLVLLDLSLPDSTLEKTVETFREHQPEIALIVLTSLDDLKLAEKAIAGGAQDYLVKSELSGTLLVRSVTYAIEQKKHELALQQSNKDLQQFASTIAHEIKNPLAVMSSCFSIIKRRHGETLSDSTLGLISNTESKLIELTSLINELLGFAKFNPEVDVSEVDFSKLIDDVILEYRSAIKRKKANITLSAFPKIKCDKTLMKQVFSNLVGNSLKYCSSSPEIQIEVEDLNSEWQFAIRDNGIGISKNSIESIFEIFQRADNAGAIPGTGIGLAFSKRIIEHHQGSIWCESIIDSGTTFYFTIPKEPEVREIGC